MSTPELAGMSVNELRNLSNSRGGDVRKQVDGLARSYNALFADQKPDEAEVIRKQIVELLGNS